MENPDKKTKQLNLPILISSIMASIVVAITFIAYASQFHSSLGDQEKFGQFGDYIGGILNPTLTAVNIFLLIYFHKEILDKTNQSQGTAEKSLQIAEQNLQKSQESFLLAEDRDQIFKLIENHHYILRSLMAKDDEGEIHRGIDTFWLFRGMLEKGYKIQSRNTEEKKENAKGAEEKKNGKDINSLKESYNFIYKEQQQRQYLGHYFRNLFHIFKFIDESQFNEKEKSEYAEIVRAQLSYLELHFLFLNCLIEEGEDFRQYVTKFELLKELEYFEFNPKSKKDNITPIRIEISPTIETWKKETPCPNVPT
ncbi:putative phage abortive infection protein [Neisseria sp. LACPHL-SPEC-2024-00856]|uniref:putative phage abortive infection protein n=1 Tax=Neisseria sp. LACPHL-SPEC-2024-00856 TaxID=3391057 RepID=UPI003A4D7EB5